MGADSSRKTAPKQSKSYHFGDDHPPPMGPDQDSTVRSMARHDPPARRHTVQFQIPAPGPNLAQQINYRAAPGQQTP